MPGSYNYFIIQTMDNSRNSRTITWYASRLLGPGGRRALLAALVRLSGRNASVRLPYNFPEGNAVVLLPDDLSEALPAVRCLLSLAAALPPGKLSVVGEERVVPYFSGLEGVTESFTYALDRRDVFARPMIELGRSLSCRGFNLCVLLEREPDLSILHLAAQTRAGIRIGYDSGGTGPFLNVRLRSNGIQTHLGNRALRIAELLGAKPIARFTWTVPKETSSEVSHLLQECGLGASATLVGVDVPGLYNHGGPEWLRELLVQLQSQGRHAVYLYSMHELRNGLRDWARSTGLPVLSLLPPSRLLALVARSSVIVSGRSPLYQIAELVDRPAVGVFRSDEIGLFCTPSPRWTGVAYDGRPGSDTARKVIEFVAGQTVKVTRTG